MPSATRYSKDFFRNPNVPFDWEDRELYAALYPESFIRKILADLKLKEEHYDLLRFSMLNAAMNYEIGKQHIHLKQKAPNERKQDLRDFASKARAFRGSYLTCLNSGTAFFDMLFAANGEDFYSNKHPRSVAMLQLFIEKGTIYSPALSDFLLILEEMAESAIPKIEDNGTNESQLYMNWVTNLSEILFESPDSFSQGKYDRESKSYSSAVMKSLVLIMSALDGKVKEAQLAQAIKDARKQAIQEGRLVKSTRLK